MTYNFGSHLVFIFLLLGDCCDIRPKPSPPQVDHPQNSGQPQTKSDTSEISHKNILFTSFVVVDYYYYMYLLDHMIHI